MAIDLKEDKIFKEFIEFRQNKKNGNELLNDNLNSIKMSQKDIDNDFENLDIENY